PNCSSALFMRPRNRSESINLSKYAKSFMESAVSDSVTIPRVPSSQRVDETTSSTVGSISISREYQSFGGVSIEISSSLYAEIVEHSFIISPMFMNLDEKLKVDFLAEQTFNIPARERAYLFQFSAGASYYDRALRCPLDIDRAMDIYEILHLFPFFANDGGC